MPTTSLLVPLGCCHGIVALVYSTLDIIAYVPCMCGCGSKHLGRGFATAETPPLDLIQAVPTTKKLGMAQHLINTVGQQIHGMFMLH